MTVELLWWDGCPSHPEALAELERVLREEGVDGRGRRWIEVETTSRRGASAFPARRRSGSTARTSSPPGEGEPFSLTCRVYRLRDGRVSPTPDPEDLRDAVRRAA